MKNFLRHLSSLIAPVLMCLIIPYLIVRSESQSFARSPVNPSGPLAVAGAVLALAGLALAVLTIRMFIRISQGTIMPWDPSRKLITSSLYSYVRNPMILSILILQTGEALLFASKGIAILAALFFVINTVYFIFSEEPGLEKRFGQEYVEYKRNVPRWIPRIRPWRP